MAINTASGTKVFIGPGVTDSTNSVAAFAALTYVEVGQVESVGEFGDESAGVTFAAIGDSRTRKAKGARDAGTLALTVGHDPLDAGQLALVAAEGTNNVYAVKIVLSDGPAGYTDTIQYFRALVRGKRLNVGTNDNVVRRSFNLDIDSQIYEVPAEEDTP